MSILPADEKGYSGTRCQCQSYFRADGGHPLGTSRRVSDLIFVEYSFQKPGQLRDVLYFDVFTCARLKCQRQKLNVLESKLGEFPA
jgi:hypothetical protein